MSKILPPSRPKQHEQETRATAEVYGVTDKVFLVGVRGYYLDTMGKPGVNDRSIYDDAIFLVSPNVYAAFNANTDPSIFRPGVASLEKGVWLYKTGIHGLSKPKARQYKAFVQAAKVRVRRDGQGVEEGYFGINIHRGGYGTTSSLGCQTIHPTQWDAFLATTVLEMQRAGQKTIKYVLVDP